MLSQEGRRLKHKCNAEELHVSIHSRRYKQFLPKNSTEGLHLLVRLIGKGDAELLPPVPKIMSLCLRVIPG